MPSVENFIEKYFPDANYIGGEYHCRCPAHNDLRASLHITQGDESDGYGSTKILMNCKAGCSTKEILEKLGASWSEINGKDRRDEIRKKIRRHYRDDEYLHDAEVTDIYDYEDQDQNYLYSRVRFRLPDGSKDMRYMQINYRLGSIRSFSRGHDPIPYHLPELLKSIDQGYPVYIVEGEKDVHTLQDQLHYVATTAGSASDWKSDFARWFRGASVVILPDNDKAGRKAVEKIQRDLLEYAYQVKIVYTSQQDHGDVTDYLTEEGGSPEELKQMISDQSWIPAVWLSIDKKDKHTINTDLLASCIDRNEHYLIVRQPGDDKDTLYTFQHGVYTKVSRNLFIADIIRPYIPRGRATANLLDNTMKLILTAGSHTVRYSDLNQNEKYINVKNGLLNIDSWELEAHRPELLSTIQLDVEYKPEANRKKNFDRYIKDLIKDPDGNEDPEKEKVIQEYIGLVLSNVLMMKRVKQVLFLLSFVGNTGKSTLLRLIDSIMGKEHIAAIDLVELDYRSGTRFVLGGMNEKRLISCGDQSSAVIKDSSRFKKLTGGDDQLYEEKGKQGSYQTFNGGIIIAGNQLPFFMDDQGDHVYKRILAIPLQHRIIKKDTGLEDRMLQEKSAIFNWFMEGLQRIRENDYQLTECAASQELLTEYSIDNDPVKRFRSECYEETGDPRDLIQVTTFYRDYYQWCDQINLDKRKQDHVARLGKKAVKLRMQADGIFINKHGNIRAEDSDDGKEHRNVICYMGIKRKDNEQ